MVVAIALIAAVVAGVLVIPFILRAGDKSAKADAERHRRHELRSRASPGNMSIVM